MRYQLRHIRTAPRLAVAHRVARMNISRRRTWNTNRGPETGFHLHGRPDPGFCGPARTGPPDACRHGTGTAPTRLRRLADPELGPRVRLATVFRCRSGDRATRGPIAQWKSAPFTPERSLVRTQLGPHFAYRYSPRPGIRDTGAVFVSTDSAAGALSDTSAVRSRYGVCRSTRTGRRRLTRCLCAWRLQRFEAVWDPGSRRVA